MTYQIKDIGAVIWKISKGKEIYDLETYQEQLDYISTKLSEYTGWPGKYSERNIVDLCVGTLADYIGTGLVRPYQIVEMFKTLNGDSIIESIFGKDTRTQQEKTICSILSVLRYSQVVEGDTILIDFGQYD